MVGLLTCVAQSVYGEMINIHACVYAVTHTLLHTFATTLS